MPPLRFVTVLLAVLLCTGPLAFAHRRDAVGGGWRIPGLRGEYFANLDLSGSPAFQRAEVRLDFDWGEVLPVGGSIVEPYRSFPKDQFSARFTGTFVPAFTETYTFRLIADDGARLAIRAEGATDWTTLIDAWTQPGTSTASLALVAGEVYEARIEYRELTGTARLRLLWSSPSCPEEVIDPVTQIGFNHASSWSQTFADVVKCGRNTFEPFGNGPVPQDANGWPMNDTEYVLQETLNQGLDIDPLFEGLVSFSFRGRAIVDLQGNVDHSSLSYTYDAAANRTTGTFRTTPRGWNVVNIRFRESDRDGQQPARRNGITDLRVMRPLHPLANESYPEEALFIGEIKTAVENFTALRLQLNNANQESHWADRTLPTFFNQANGPAVPTVYPPDYGPIGSGPSWEHKIMLCNETGRDCYLNIPMMATGWEPGDTQAYVNKLARLIKYGSDGVEPYSGPVANPVYPPLNPNLRLYIELSNEVWNFGGNAFRQSIEAVRLAQADAEAFLDGATGDPRARPQDFPILNYDQLTTERRADGEFVSVGTWRLRKLILRVIQISNIFRAEFGDAAMHTRVRPIYEWQYDDGNGTASGPLGFAEDWFNNGDGIAHVATPRPVSYHLWGGGGATYYGAANPYGVTGRLANSSFEIPAAGPGTYVPLPQDSGWNFQGTAGIARDGGTADEIPPAAVGQQVAYIDGTGAMETTVTIPATQVSNRYAFVFRAVQRVRDGAPMTPEGYPEPDTQKVRVFINGQPSNARSFNQSDGYQPLPWNADFPWESFVVFWTRGTTYYSTGVFEAAPGATVTLRIEGTAAAGNIAFIDDVRLGSVDALFDGGLPGGGEAFGQPVGSGYQSGLNVQANWALAYGLQYITYEGGWSLGSDTGGSPMQNHAKYSDPRAADANHKALDDFHLAGGVLNTLGTYAQWPGWAEYLRTEGLLDLENNPLLTGQRRILRELPSLPTNGVNLPRTMSLQDTAITRGRTGNTLAARGWATWNLIAPVTGTYQIRAVTDPGSASPSNATWRLMSGPQEINLPPSASASASVFLTKGIHGLRVEAGSAPLTLSQLEISMVGAPAQPEITSVTDGNLSLSVEWTPISGATAYVLSWGTSPGTYTNSLTTTNPSAVITGLIHNTGYYFTVRATNGSLASLPSLERGAIALAAGQPGVLAAWDLLAAGSINGDAEAIRATTFSSKLAAGALRRGPGMRRAELLRSNAGGIFDSESAASISTETAARELDYYFEWEVTPLEGRTLDLAELRLQVYADGQANAGGVSVDILIDGVASPIPLGSQLLQNGELSPNLITYDLSGNSGLDSLASRARFRVYFFGISPYAHRGFGFVPGSNADIQLSGSVADATLSATSPPVILPTAGAQSTARTIRILPAAAGSVIRYTLDNTCPSPQNGFTYAGPFEAPGGSVTCRAIAQQPGKAWSRIAEASWTFPATNGEVLVESDFSGTNPGQNLPWNKTKQRAAGLTFSGWTFARFDAWGGFDEIFGHDGNDALVFSQFMRSDGARLSEMMTERKFLTAQMTFSAPADLRGSRLEFTVERLFGHAPVRTSVFTSIEGFDLEHALFTTPRYPFENAPQTFSFRFPQSPAYAAVSGPVEVRLVFHDGAYAFHRTSLRAFQWALRPSPPRPTLETASLPDARIGTPYAASLTASGIAPLSVSANGTVPAGLSIAPESSLQGRPRSAGTFSVPISITDADGFTSSASLSLTIRSPYADWLASRSLSPSQSPSEDPYGGEIPALARHTFGVTAGAEQLPRLLLVPQGVGYQAQRDVTATDTEVEIWRSTNLISWEKVYSVTPESEELLGAEIDTRSRAGNLETILLRSPGTNGPLFYRSVVRFWNGTGGTP